MDKCRQQNVRSRRMNQRVSYQPVGNCGCQNRANMTSNCACNQNCGENGSVARCPEMVNDPLCGMPLAMAYVPWQRFENLYEECTAIYHGTLFRDLDLDFYGVRCD